MGKRIIPVVAAVIVQHDPTPRVLLRYRATDESPDAEQNWECPGGVMCYREDPEETVVREIREELGVTPTVLRLVHAQSNIYASQKHYLVLYYECRIGDQPTPDGCRWFRLRDLIDLPMLPGTREAIEGLGQSRTVRNVKG